MTRPDSPKEFADAIAAIIFSTEQYDVEDKHMMLDEIMEELLISLGYEEGVHMIRNTERWYG